MVQMSSIENRLLGENARQVASDAFCLRDKLMKGVIDDGEAVAKQYALREM